MTYNMEKTFYEMVYDVVRLIPKGRVTSYGAIAKCLGAGGSARMVGYAMNNAHGMHPPVPAHRVVNRNGYLTGKFHFTPPELMQQLLENEGLTIVEDKIQHFKIHNWDPAEEI
jgi:methylated-DNA-protein-cysteine methyltransferase-like protein